MSLINMPFASLNLPSLGLTQLKSVMEDRFKDELSVEICYVNQDFGRVLGVDLYTYIALSGEAHNTGLGDWFFRQVAFPEMADNSDAYFRRFFPSLNPSKRAMRQFMLEKRKELDAILDSIIAKYRLDRCRLLVAPRFSQNVASLRCKDLAFNQAYHVMGRATARRRWQCVVSWTSIDYYFRPGLKLFPSSSSSISTTS